MKYYAVRVGKVPGVYTTWDKCKEMVNGYSGAEFKSFGSLDEAQKFVGKALEEKVEGSTPIYTSRPPTYAVRQTKLGVVTPVVSTLFVAPALDAPAPALIGPFLVAPPPEDRLLSFSTDLSTVVYFDGSCRNKVAGAACYFPDTHQVFYGKLAGEGTNSRAELYGLILALTRTEATKLIIYGDSTYALNQGSGVQKARANLDLVAEIKELVKGREIDFRHVYGHTGQRENEICDHYAVKALTLESTIVLDEYVPNV
jgi:ribonuclease HI